MFSIMREMFCLHCFLSEKNVRCATNVFVVCIVLRFAIFLIRFLFCMRDDGEEDCVL